jgi:hypothetical protein
MAAAPDEVHAHAAIVGERIVTNASYNDRVADLARGEVNSYIIGWSRNGGRNQVVRILASSLEWLIADTTFFSMYQFNFVPQGGNTDKISLTAGDGSVFYVASPNPGPVSVHNFGQVFHHLTSFIEIGLPP